MANKTRTIQKILVDLVTLGEELAPQLRSVENKSTQLYLDERWSTAQSLLAYFDSLPEIVKQGLITPEDLLETLPDPKDLEFEKPMYQSYSINTKYFTIDLLGEESSKRYFMLLSQLYKRLNNMSTHNSTIEEESTSPFEWADAFRKPVGKSWEELMSERKVATAQIPKNNPN